MMSFTVALMASLCSLYSPATKTASPRRLLLRREVHRLSFRRQNPEALGRRNRLPDQESPSRTHQLPLLRQLQSAVEHDRLWLLRLENGKVLESSDPITSTLIDDENPPVSFVRFSPNGKFILVGTHDNTLVSSYAPIIYFCNAYCCGTFLLLNSLKHTLATPTLSTPFPLPSPSLMEAELQEKLEGHTEPVMSVACHPTDNLIASGSLDKSIRLWTQKK
ncbi:hypothetical protein HID58_022164 [Brassica napus]|uniref:Uncharacterized protein n=1 Tax=Brassica napus TaxID=3708 RepID=A0ABQ8D0W7_BRANA|nr:hypothetical protein HID58_022164 [Brassica napus]